MAKLPFREHHLFEIIYGYEEKNIPIDLWVSQYFRAHSSLGSKDRAYIAETFYALMRWQGALDFIAGGSPNWQKRLEVYNETDFSALHGDETIPPHVRVSFPKELFDLFVANFGQEEALKLCYDSNFPAPTVVRANALKISREALFEKWKTTYAVSPTQQSPWGIVFHKKINFFSLPEFREGLFEVQDEASQLIAGLLEATPGQQVLDYCSGSGGKALAFAPLLKQKGQIYLHDIRERVLLEARRRLKRAGIQNSQVIKPNDLKLKKLKKQMDWVFADVPCSGTGTLRRNPDMKWKFDVSSLSRLCGLQREIFEKALSFLKPDGKIVYATCSILKQENQDQVDHFLQTYNLKIVGKTFQSFPRSGEMDGFFGVVLEREAAAK